MMKTRSHRPPAEEEYTSLYETEDSLDLEALTDEDLEALLFDPEEEQASGIWNLPTVAGLSLIVVGVAYLFQELGIWSGFDLSILVGMLPWLAGVLIILLGFGVLSWRPKKRQKVKVKKAVEPKSGKKKVVVEAEGAPTEKKRLVRSRNKKIAGVCGGLAEYFNMDPTLVRIAFVIVTIATQGSFLLGYLALTFIMPKPEARPAEERVTVVRDS